jgi:phosphoribosylamine--glycine ligase
VQQALSLFSGRIVVKADGLAAGKGVVIANSKEEASHVAAEMLNRRLVGEAGALVVLEEFLEGEELSFLVLSDGNTVLPLVPSRDHKRVGDGDTGPNTGGMGAYSDDVLLDSTMREWLMHHVAQPVVEGMKSEGVPYKGVLYIGLMMTARGPMVLEFNCRFGDPETQAVLFRLESDLAEICDAVAQGGMHADLLRWSPQPSICVVIASGGYPGAFTSGQEISGLEEAEAVPGVKVFHAGTAHSGENVVTSGGRVLGVTACGDDLKAAAARAYEAAEKIHFQAMQYRRDIGKSAISYKQ